MSLQSVVVIQYSFMSVYEELSETQQFACRVIADHARSTAFAIADGILPGNEGRNYVLRKIMRRAIYHGREHLGLKEAFFYKVCDLVVENFSAAFPELAVQRDFIGKMVRIEEERFGNTVTVGLGKLSEMLRRSDFIPTPETPSPGILEIRELAKLYDTYGLPVDLIYVVLSTTYPKISSHYGVEFWALRKTTYREGKEHKIEYFSFDVPKPVYDDEDEILIDTNTDRPVVVPETIINYGDFTSIIEEDFRSLIDDELKELQRQSGIGQTQRKGEINPVYLELSNQIGSNEFHGYDRLRVQDARIIAILDGERRIDSLSLGQQGSIVLDRTPFYAESGGQVGDTGLITAIDRNGLVTDTYSPVPGLIIHKVKVRVGSFSVGEIVDAEVSKVTRDATRRNHTATHLVHAALKEVLGTHVKQAGSVVAPNYLRFDFTHYQPMSDAEITEVEDLVNRYILQNQPVTTDMMAIEEAMRSGAVAMFGEKYGSEVRVLSVGDGAFSRELCGGTHVRATGDIGSFKITADEAIASGVRRIRAITGFDAFARFREDELLIDRSLDVLKTQRDQLPNAIEKLQDELKRTRKEIDDLKLKIATGQIGGASSNGDEAREVAGVKVVGKIVDGLDANGMRQLSDTLLARLKSGVVVLGRSEEGKAGIIVRVSDDLKERVKAGNVVKEIVPILGGKGGGRPDMAEGGGPQSDKLNEAIEASYKVIETLLGP